MSVLLNLLAHTKREGDHLLWQGALDRDGAPVIRSGRKVVRARRYMYEANFGPLPDNHVVRATCGLRSCILPSHLEAVPRSEFAKLPRPGAQKRYRRYGPRDLFLNPRHRSDPRWAHLFEGLPEPEKPKAKGKSELLQHADALAKLWRQMARDGHR